MITYPVPSGSLWSEYQLSSASVVSRNRTWPNASGTAIEGQDPGFVWLRQIDTLPPVIDRRFYSLKSIEAIDVDSNEIKQTYQAIKLPIEEIIINVGNVETEKLTNLVDLVKDLVEMRILVGALLDNTLNAQQPPARVKTLAQAFITKSKKVLANRDWANTLIGQINAGNEPNLDGGWVES